MKTTANAVREGVEAAAGGQLGEAWGDAMARSEGAAGNLIFDVNVDRSLRAVMKAKWG